jgi:hypothetical protein
MSEAASATIAALSIRSGEWQYSITLTDVGTTAIGTFWFAWLPGQDLMATRPTTTTNPGGWTHLATGGGVNDGFAIQWLAASPADRLQPGGHLTGLTFVSMTPPSVMFGNSQPFPGTPTLTSVIYTGAPFSDAGDTFEVTPLCFLPGTRIRTIRGEVAVELLAIGDLVVTLTGAKRRIKWIGSGKVLATPARRNAATPVIVRKSALDDNVPCRDLHVTKGHSLYLDGVLIPVEFLINHRTILWDDRAGEVTVYHIELETHDVLVADGAPAESYRDDGNRWLFQNINENWDRRTYEPCAPVLTGGPVVDAVWRRLVERAGQRGNLKLTDESDLHLVLNGRRLDAVERVGDVYVFRLPVVPSVLHMVSRAAVPAKLGLARDPRRLGVALREIAVRKGARFRVIKPSDARLSAGFHDFEAISGLRWTNGDAVLPARLFGGFTAPLELVVRVGASTRYLADRPALRVA